MNSLKYCFRSFAFTHILSLILAFPCSLILNNILNGIYWFIIPVILVVINENGAYFIGRFFGRTLFSELSPRKTWEGVIGGTIASLIFSLIVSDNFLLI